MLVGGTVVAVGVAVSVTLIVLVGEGTLVLVGGTVVADDVTVGIKLGTIWTVADGTITASTTAVGV